MVALEDDMRVKFTYEIACFTWIPEKEAVLTPKKLTKRGTIMLTRPRKLERQKMESKKGYRGNCSFLGTR